MNIVPIISDGVIVKDHTQYPITNTGWRLMNGTSLYEYLKTLEINGYYYGTIGMSSFYLRERYNDDYMISRKLVFDTDPWNRRFPSYPTMNGISAGENTSVYKSKVYKSYIINGSVYVVTTTIHRFPVYCVDIVKNS